MLMAPPMSQLPPVAPIRTRLWSAKTMLRATIDMTSPCELGTNVRKGVSIGAPVRSVTGAERPEASSVTLRLKMKPPLRVKACPGSVKTTRPLQCRQLLSAECRRSVFACVAVPRTRGLLTAAEATPCVHSLALLAVVGARVGLLLLLTMVGAPVDSDCVGAGVVGSGGGTVGAGVA